MNGFLLSFVQKLCLPDSVRSFLKRKWKNHLRNQRLKTKAKAIASFGFFDTSDLLNELRKAGFPSGGTLFVHCSFDDLYTFRGFPEDLLGMLKELVGPAGNLLMPAFSTNTWKHPPRPFIAKKEPTYTGILNELFRRSPGTVRSLHPRHSIIGTGKQVKDILSGHEKCLRAAGPDSPFDRLRKMEDSYILMLGLTPATLTFLHWTEDFDPELFPIRAHEPHPIVCPVIAPDGSTIEVVDWQIRKGLQPDLRKISHLISNKAMKNWTFKGVRIGLYHMQTLANELVALRDKGIVVYKVY